ncbi:AAA family ATPase [Paenibacillus sp. L3-i20]|uniref:AAA family ATPase n=1 Tax=Paenibacillus sp. L3-i20 TaxID=2905833 RepID=UPI0020C00564|nr:AAA family ATPase [Paenibacillus sp. L3-i20]
MEDASIVLKKGLNVINGPSNTGKSYIFKCIDYMFGADTLKEIKESRAYENIFLEMRDFENDNPITLLRFINKKSIYYAYSNINDFYSVKNYKLKSDHDANRDDNISKFLLKLMGITENKFMLSNKSGFKKTLGYRSIANLSMISETKIISDTDSPIYNRIKPDETYCKSVLKFLLTGIDDINCEEIEKAEIRKAKIDSKIEYINNEINNLSVEQTILLKQLEDASFEKVVNINEYSEEIIKIENLIEGKRREIIDKQNLQNKLNLQRNQLTLLIDKFKILNKQYKSDLERLTFLQNGDDCLKQIHINQCPICNSKIDDDAFNEEFSLEIMDASQQEVVKINLHISELSKTIDSTNLEIKEIELANKEYELEISNRKIDVEELVLRELTPLRSVLTAYLEVTNIQNKIKSIDERVSSKYTEIIGLNEAKKQKQPKLNYISTIPVGILKEFTDEIFNTLSEWGYEGLETVTFDEKEQDILINDQARKSNGKGFRAFFYAAFSVSLMNYLLSKNHPFTRVLLLDSPVTTLKENELKGEGKQDDDMIDVSMQDSLFISLSQSSDNKQIIILENKELPGKVVKCNHISFTKGTRQGRYGFFPMNNENVLVEEGV